MKKLNKKGFTIVELVIVIAVIAILAAVMIPTFSGIIDKANKSAALSEAKATHTALLYHFETPDELNVDGVVDAYIVVDDKYYFSVDDGELKALDAKPTDVTFSESATTDADYELTSVEDATAKVYLYTAATVADGGEGA